MITFNIACDDIEYSEYMLKNQVVSKNIATIIGEEIITFPALTEETNDENMTCNIAQVNNTYTINNNSTSKKINENYVIDRSSNPLSISFTPLAESTFTEKVLALDDRASSIDNTDCESDNSIAFEHDANDSFHLSDCSLPEDTEEDTEEDEVIENTTNSSVNKTSSTLNLTSSLCTSKISVCDDKDMRIKPSENSKTKN